MPRLRASRPLACFYCGKRTGSKYDGVVRNFTCTNCEATNYLDENGEITDPPVAATEREAPTQYTVPKSSPIPSSSQADSIFCEKCIKNQRLFTASLAQYLPDDPSDPQYPELERNYHRYRRSLEQRYPQVCENCAEKVDGQIRQAGYTAKTDHLRRMMERSRGRKAPQRTSALDWASSLGRWLWWGGLLLQMLWHIVLVADVLGQTDSGMYDPDDDSITATAVTVLRAAVALMPGPDTLVQGSLTASILCVWWNPHFVQVNRGFTRHLLGFTQWYSFQGLIVFFRFVFRRVLAMEGGNAQSQTAQLSAHVVIAAVTSLIYFLASRSIRVDTTPLFGTYEGTVSPKATKLSMQEKRDSAKTLADILDEALDSPVSTPQKAPLRRAEANALPSSRPLQNPIMSPGSPQLGFNSLGLGESAAQQDQDIQYDDQMDWTPTQSQHRAFSSSGNTQPAGVNGKQQFGHAPVQPNSGAFWYKVPPAPVDPARRLRNPPNAPVIKSKAPATDPFFGGRSDGQGNAADSHSPGVSFQQPKFFAQRAQRESDEANSLVDLLGKSFSLSPEQEPDARTPPKPSMWTVPNGRSRELSQRAANRRTGSGHTGSTVEPCILSILIALWLVTSFIAVPYGLECQLATLAVAGVLALRLMGETNKAVLEQQLPRTAAYFGSALGVVELAALCWIGWEAWKGQMEVEMYGFGVLGTMLGHQIWNTVM